MLRSFSGDPVPVLEASGIRGMGGAGFPTGRKWGMVRGQDSPVKYVDLQRRRGRAGDVQGPPDPRGAAAPRRSRGCSTRCARSARRRATCSSATSTSPEEEVLRAELARAPFGEAESIEVFTSPGGYILGEETALIECMEGHRGEPRNKPPFPGGYGLHGLPTLMNNVETFASVPAILGRGADWWKAQGVNGGEGLKFFSVSGPRRGAGRVLRAERDDGRRGDRARGRHPRRRRARRRAAGRRVDELPRAGLPRPAADVRRGRRGGLRARHRRDGRDGRGDRPARGGDDRARVLPQRVVRQVRALPRGLAQGGADPDRGARARRQRGGRRRAHRRARGDACGSPRSAGSARSRSPR